MREKRLKGIIDKYLKVDVMELTAFMGLIGLASVFVMVSLGYEGKKGNNGYISKLLRKHIKPRHAGA